MNVGPKPGSADETAPLKLKIRKNPIRAGPEKLQEVILEMAKDHS